MMSTVERLALAAIIAALVGLDAWTEEGRSLAEAGAANVDPTGSQAQTAPDPSRSPLGRWHLWAKGKIGSTSAGDLTWRVHRLLIGVDMKYQTAADWLYQGYPNVRLGAHLGVAF